MNVGPADPRRDTSLRIVHDVIRPQRNGREYLGGRNGHQADVPATVETRVRRGYLPELTMTLEERVNGRATIEQGYGTEHHGPRVEEDEG